MLKPRWKIPAWYLLPMLSLFIVISFIFGHLYGVCMQKPEIGGDHSKTGTTLSEDKSHAGSNEPISTGLPQKATDDDIFRYKDPGIAGTGSSEDEVSRYFLYLYSQGVVCKNVHHFGGHYHKGYPPPETDPDGAWYLCLDPEVSLVKGSCIVYSIGINDEWSFDDSIAKFGCRVYAFDPSMNKDPYFRSPSIQFFNTGLADIDYDGNFTNRARRTEKANWKTRTLKSIIRDLNHTKILVDVVKIDIERDEWKTLHQLLADGTLRKYVKQFDVEFHLGGYQPSLIRSYYGIGMWLDRQGFKIANMHKNSLCPGCYETTYINTNLIKLPVRSPVTLEI